MGGFSLLSREEPPTALLFSKALGPGASAVSSVELLMKYHQGINAEIETRSKNFSACLELGESLLQRQHQASEEVRGRQGWR